MNPQSTPPIPSLGAGVPQRRLTGLLAQVSNSRSGPLAARRAVGLTADAVGADFCILIRDRSVAALIGSHAGAVPVAELIEAARGGVRRCTLPGLGPNELSAVALDGEPATWLVAGRRQEAFTESEVDLIVAVARVLALTLQVARAAEEQQDLHRRRRHEMLQRRRAERELVHLGLHDRLTGLPNRQLMRDRTKHALERARRGDGFVAALFIDLDQFKLANDSLDPDGGDQLLVLIAGRLKAILVLEDDGRRLTLGRHGSDEFIVLCEDLGTERDAIVVAQQIRDALGAPFYLHGREVRLTACIGVVFATADQLDPARLDADGLLRDADVAVARAKDLGRDRYEIFDKQMRVRLLGRAALDADLRAGLERGELRLHYQPVVAAADGSLVAAEALVRWQHPTRGLLGPEEFIGLAEESDLIVALGTWVIDEACEQIRRWRDAHPAQLGVRVSVNVSARQLSPALVARRAGARAHRRGSLAARARDHRDPADRPHRQLARGTGVAEGDRRRDRARRLRYRLLLAQLPAGIPARPAQARSVLHG